MNITILDITLNNGGAERVISRLLPSLAEDFNVDLVLFYDLVSYDIPDTVKKTVLLNKTVPATSIFDRLKDLFMTIKAYNRFVRKNHIDVSVSFLTIPNIVNGIISMRNNKLKTILSERCYPSIMYNRNRLSLAFVKIVYPLFYNRATKIFSNSVHINKDLRENFRIKRPMSVIYNPIDIGPERLESSEIIGEHNLKIITAGTLYDTKNHQMILDALNSLNNNEFSLTVLGKGPLKDELNTFAKNNGLEDRVDLKGRVENVKEHYLEHDCFVLSSNNEGFPNALLEAMSVGLPCVSTNCLSGPLELLNDNDPVDIPEGQFILAKYGILVNVNDSDGLAAALFYLKNNVNERKRYSELCAEKAKDFELSNIYKQVKELIIS